MRRLAALALCGALGACAELSSTDARMSEGKALADAWVSLGTAAQVADGLVHAGSLHGRPAAQVSADLKAADLALTDATAIYKANGDPSAQILAATVALTDITKLTGVK